MTRAFALTAFALAAAGLIAPPAHSDGLPVTGVDAGPIGLVGPSGTARLLALPAGPGTVVAEADPATGSVRRSIYLPGKFTIPTVALDGSATGLSRDGRTLVLIRPRRTFPQESTRLALVDTRKLRLRRMITLDGDFSVDALSPDAGTLFLINYYARRDYTRYRVRAFDAASAKLLPGAIVDSREPDERMAGWPITRAYSADGRWAYTLYDGTEGHPFIHALDTVTRQARCIDLDDLAGMRSDRLYALRLVQVGATLKVMGGNGPLATVDTRTHELVTNTGPAPSTPTKAPVEQQSSLLWPGVAGGLLALGGAAVALRRRRAYHRSSITAP